MRRPKLVTAEIDEGNPRRILSVAHWLGPYRPAIALVVVTLLVAAGAELAIGAAVRTLVDGGFRPGRGQGVQLFLLALVAIGIVYAAATFFRLYLVSWLGERLVADIRKDFFSHVLHLGPDFFETAKTADVISRLVTDTSLLQGLMVATAPSGLHGAVLLVGSATLMAVTSVKLATIVFALLPLLVFPAIRISRRLRRLSRDAQSKLGDVGALANESLRSISTVQAFSHEDLESARVAKGIEAAFLAGKRRFITEATLATMMLAMVFGVMATVLWVGTRDVSAGRMTAGQLTAFVLYTLMAITSLANLSGFWAQLQRAAGAIERVMEMLRVQPTIRSGPAPIPLPAPTSGAISFRHVTFHYPSRPSTEALSDISLEIQPGETVALVGPSGAGKSTIFNLLLRFYDPQLGEITLDGVDIALVDPRDLRSRFGYVSQEPALFSTTVAENVRYGRLDATDDEVMAAAEAAAAREFIEKFPEGFQSHLGEEGVRLSGGQRQRLAIARALLRDSAGILLFDEATSALDSESEKRIQDALGKAAAQRTAIIIAHRLATVKMADRIVVMDQGRVTATGTHAGLLRDSELYARLASLQFDLKEESSAPSEDDLGVRKRHLKLPGWERDRGRLR